MKDFRHDEEISANGIIAYSAILVVAGGILVGADQGAEVGKLMIFSFGSVFAAFASSKFVLLNKGYEHLAKLITGIKIFIIPELEQNGLLLEFASKPLKNDREVVLTAVRQNGLALEFASDILRGDQDLVQEAIQEDASALRYVTDKKLVIDMIERRGAKFRDVSDNMKNDPEVVQAAYNLNHDALAYASNDLKVEFIKGNIDNICYATSAVKILITDGIMGQLKGSDSVDTLWKDSNYTIDKIVRVMGDMDLYEMINNIDINGVGKNHYESEYNNKYNEQSWSGWAGRTVALAFKRGASAMAAAADTPAGRTALNEGKKSVVRYFAGENIATIWSESAPTRERNTPSSESKSEGANNKP